MRCGVARRGWMLRLGAGAMRCVLLLPTAHAGLPGNKQHPTTTPVACPRRPQAYRKQEQS